MTNSSSAIPTELLISKQDHSIDPVSAKAIVNRYSTNNQGGFFKIATIQNMIQQAGCSGIRYYFAKPQKILSIIVTATTKIAVGKHDDLHNGYLAGSETLLIDQVPADQRLLLSNAALQTLNYRSSTFYADGIKGGIIGVEAINALLTQAGCIGIRFYIGKDAAGKKTAVLYGVNSSGVDLTSYVCDQAVPCPTFCSNNNVLNTGA